MAKDKKAAPKSNDARRAAKAARTASNKARRAKAHAKRMAEQQLCPKRGLRRSIRRWCDRISREPAAVLKQHKKLASLVRVKEKPTRSEPELSISINGKPMGSMAELVWTGRQLEFERAQRLKGIALGS